MSKYIKYIDNYNFKIAKNTTYISLRYNDARVTLNNFLINVGFGPRINMDALRYSIYKNLIVSLYESDIKYIFPDLAASSIKTKVQFRIKTNTKN